MAERLAAEGASVVVADLSHCRDTAPASVDFVACDVRHEEEVEMLFAQATDRLGGPIDAVVTSAGVVAHPGAAPSGVVDLTAEQWRYVLDVNLTGTFLTCRAAAARLLAAGCPGTMVLLASAAAKRPSKGAYSVSKAGVWMLARALASELGPHGIRVNAIGPGYIRTPMLESLAESAGAEPAAWFEQRASRVPLRRIGTPSDVADVAVFLTGPESAFVTGSIIHPDGGSTSEEAGG